MNTETNIAPALFVKMVLTAWQLQNTRADEIVEALSDEQLQQETAPGRNTGIYLFGHLAAVNDGIFTILGLGERLHPELDEIFVDTPDKSGRQMPSIETLKQYWKEINGALTDRFNKLTPEAWFEKHNSISAEDFAKEPHRNKLNVIITRTVHQGYHLGQMAYLKSK
jgi:hypothetical protein